MGAERTCAVTFSFLCWSEKGDFRVFKKFYMQKILNKYRRGNGAEREVMW